MVSITKDFLTINPFSRPGKKLSKVKGIVIHWYANPKSKALGNRNFFEGKKNGKGGYASAHYCIDPDNIIQAIPDNEMAYHVGSTTYTASALRNLSSYPNNCTIGIEMYHPDWTGKPDNVSYNKTVQLAAKLLKAHGLNETNLWTHHQVVGWKDCHRWYTNNPKEWVKFIADVSNVLKGKTTIITTPKPTNTKDLILVEALGMGDKGTKVRELQANLVKLGYKIEVDGIFGTKTDEAVEKFQKSKGLTADGMVGPNTTAALAKALASLTAKPVVTPTVTKPITPTNTKKPLRPYVRIYKYTSPMMSDKKLKTSDIAAIQRAVGIKESQVDGLYGYNTELAVKNYQTKRKLKADGIVGKDTWNMMF